MSQVNFSIPLNFPVNEVADALLERLLPHLLAINLTHPLPEEENLTRKATAARLKVSLPTLNEYTKKGLITAHRFGARVMYKSTDVNAALTEINFRKTSK